MWLRRQLDGNGITGPYLAVRHYDRHYTGLVDDLAVIVAPECGAHQTRLDDIELDAGATQAGDFNNRNVADHQPRPERQAQEVYAASRDVLPHLAGPDAKAYFPQLVMQLRVNQMDLPEVGPFGIACCK